jgi:hypothetical protein
VPAPDPDQAAKAYGSQGSAGARSGVRARANGGNAVTAAGSDDREAFLESLRAREFEVLRLHYELAAARESAEQRIAEAGTKLAAMRALNEQSNREKADQAAEMRKLAREKDLMQRELERIKVRLGEMRTLEGLLAQATRDNDDLKKKIERVRGESDERMKLLKQAETRQRGLELACEGYLARIETLTPGKKRWR